MSSRRHLKQHTLCPATHCCPIFAVLVKITRACGETDRALLFRGWSRLCLHAATLSAAEGASAAATTFARAAQAKAIEKEAEESSGTAEARRGTAGANAEAEEARDRAQGGSDQTSLVTAALEQNGEDANRLAREQQTRRMKTLVSARANVNAMFYFRARYHLSRKNKGISGWTT